MRALFVCVLAASGFVRRGARTNTVTEGIHRAVRPRAAGGNAVGKSPHRSGLATRRHAPGRQLCDGQSRQQLPGLYARPEMVRCRHQGLCGDACQTAEGEAGGRSRYDAHRARHQRPGMACGITRTLQTEERVAAAAVRGFHRRAGRGLCRRHRQGDALSRFVGNPGLRAGQTAHACGREPDAPDAAHRNAPACRGRIHDHVARGLWREPYPRRRHLVG